jgi:arylsulfatase A-like enzyme
MKTIRYSTLFTALLLAVCLPWGCGGEAEENEATLMPVVLVTVDGLVAEQISAFGGARPTPALTRLAEAGSVWRDGWTACPMSRPAVATYLTGLVPDRHGVREELFIALPDEVPTLATELAAKGYSTAAFPNSSLLGHASRLLRGFQIVDDPPLLPIGPHKILPLARPAEQTAENFTLWVDGLPQAAPYFAWLHFPAPMMDQFKKAIVGKPELGQRAQKIEQRRAEREKKGKGKGKGKSTPTRTEWRQGNLEEFQTSKAVPGQEEQKPPEERALESFDAALGMVLDKLEARGDLKNALVVVAPTMGDITGGEDEPLGPGFSLAERAVRVPFIVRFPDDSAAPRPTESPVWAPDIPATVADLAALKLHRDGEGLSLLKNPEDGRVLFAWSWATLDQMGWPALRAARSGGLKLAEGFEEQVIRLDGRDEAAAEEGMEKLRQALRDRSEPPAFGVGLEEVRALLEKRGVEIKPLPATGHSIESAEKRRLASDYLWRARLVYGERHAFRSLSLYKHILELDPDALAAQMEQGQAMYLVRDPGLVEVMMRAVSSYPTNPEVLHWYAHAIWPDSLENAETLIDVLLNYMPHDGDLLYDKACTRSLSGDLDRSIEYLESAIEAGFTRWNLIESDADLRPLRESPKFSELLGKYNR